MLALVGRRVISAIVLILVVTVLTFVLIHSDGEHIARNILGPDATDESVQALADRLGLDQPVVVQFWSWLSHASVGDLGNSYYSSQPVSSLLAQSIPVTLSVITAAILLTALISVAVGVAAATRGGGFDRLLQVTSVAGFALPSYWIALVLVLVIALPSQGVIPATGYLDPAASVTGWLASITLPAIALAIGGVAAVAQQVRGSMIDTMRRDYIRTFRSRGMNESVIIFRHGLRNAAGPALIVLSLTFIGMLGGAIVMEQIFALPGIGQLATNAALQSDVPVVMGVIAFTVLLVVAVNILIDLAIGWLNPKAQGAHD